MPNNYFNPCPNCTEDVCLGKDCPVEQEIFLPESAIKPFLTDHSEKQAGVKKHKSKRNDQPKIPYWIKHLVEDLLSSQLEDFQEKETLHFIYKNGFIFVNNEKITTKINRDCVHRNYFRITWSEGQILDYKF